MGNPAKTVSRKYSVAQDLVFDRECSRFHGIQLIHQNRKVGFLSIRQHLVDFFKAILFIQVG